MRIRNILRATAATALALGLTGGLPVPAPAQDGDTFIEETNEAIVDEGDISGAYGVDRPALGEQGEGLVADDADRSQDRLSDLEERDVYGGAEGHGVEEQADGIAEERRELDALAGRDDAMQEEQAELTPVEPEEDGGYPVNDDDGLFEEDEGTVE